MDFLKQLQSDFAEISFVRDKANLWSPQTREIYYRQPLSKYSILHELGHALQGHTDYTLDIQLLKMEADAWRKAQQLATNYGLKIPAKYINDCMNTYKDWMLSRAKCPDCDLVGLQAANTLTYNCCNCSLSWSVPLETKCLVRRIRESSRR